MKEEEGEKGEVDVCFDATLSRLARLHPDVADWQRQPKKIGRHAGCILVSAPDGGTDVVRYFVKEQGLCLRTLFLHHLLEEMGLGPSPFFMLASGKDRHVVVTHEIPSFRMASQQAGIDLLSKDDAICLAVLVVCFGIGDLPDNPDNWGTSANGQLAIVDFSWAPVQGLYHTPILLNLESFMKFCQTVMRKDDAQGLDDGVALATGKYGQWFRNEDTFTALLDRASEHVYDWVNDDVHQRQWRQVQRLVDLFTMCEQFGQFLYVARATFSHIINLK